MIDGAVKRVHVVGCGGIGSHLLRVLLRTLSIGKFGGEVFLWDGDHYTESNIARQDFDAVSNMRRNKADTQVLELADRYRNLLLLSRGEYVTKDNVSQVCHDGALVFTCVDNHPVRALIDQAASRVENICVLSAGNERTTGNTHVYLRREGQDLTTSLTERHPEVARARRGDRSKLVGCEELISKGDDQTLATNFMAAAVTMAAYEALRAKLSDLLTDRGFTQEVFFDLSQCAVSAVKTC